MITRSLIITLSMLALAACDNTSARYSSDYASKLNRADIVILPVYAEASKVDMTGNHERQYDYEGYIEPILAEALQKKLIDKGYRARILYKKELLANKTYREYSSFREAFKTAYEDDAKRGAILKREDAENSVISLRGNAKSLGQKINAPIMAYVEYNEQNKTNDAQVAEFIGGVIIGALTGVNTSAPPDTTLVIVALIDAENDRVLFTNKGASIGGGIDGKLLYTDDEQARKHIDNSLKAALAPLPKREDLFKSDAETKSE